MKKEYTGLELALALSKGEMPPKTEVLVKFDDGDMLRLYVEKDLCGNYYLVDFNNDEAGNSIFTDLSLKFCIREREIDWDKVPKYTKVNVRDIDCEEWKNRYFLYVDESCSKYTKYVTSLSNTKDYFTGMNPEDCCGLNAHYTQIRLDKSVTPKADWYK